MRAKRSGSTSAMATVATSAQPVARSRALRLGMLAVASIALASPSRAASVFSGFEGSWHGRGTVSLTDGSREAIRCRAAYGVRGDGGALSVDVNCASDSYRVHIVANVAAQGAAFTGSWQETTRQVGGDVTGRIPAPGEMQASLETMGGGIQLAATVRGRRQAVTMRSQGSDIQAVDVLFTR